MMRVIGKQILFSDIEVTDAMLKAGIEAVTYTGSTGVIDLATAYKAMEAVKRLAERD